MRTAVELKEAIHDLRDEVDAIIAVSERENRDLNEEETNRVTEITDAKIPHLNKQLKTAIAVEREMYNRVESRHNEEIEQRQLNDGDIGATGTSRGIVGAIKIPAKAKVHGELRAYIGPDAERDAYIAGNVILANIFHNQAAIQFCRNHGLHVQNTMVGNDNASGGFLTTEEMQRTIIRLRETRGVFPQFANRVPMGADIMTVPRLLADVIAYWVGEGVEITASDPTLGQAEMMARKLAALTKASTEFDEDAVVEIGDMLTQSMAYAMADKIDEAAFNGDGTSAYGGNLGLKNALHANATIGAATGNDSALTLDMADFEKVIGALPDYPGIEPRWYMNKAVYYASAHRLMDAAGGNTNITLANGISTPMFLGYPVTFVQVMPGTTSTLALTIVAYFGDLRLGASYGVRRSIRMQVSLDRYFENDLIGIKTTERVGILIHERGETINTRPILALKTAA